ncbi:MAG TPA: MlaD family protein [Planctomycetota bacterium]|nr:MlaD family protein [Planctomycetota bacterium]
MKPSSKLELKVGMLIIGGIIATVALVLLTDRIRFDSYYTVNAFLADAAGLRQGSPVTLDGVRIGEVEGVTVVGDARGNIQVKLRVNQRHPIPSDSKLTLASSGIFGDSFMAFSGASDPKAPLLPMDGTASVQASRGFFDKAGQQAEVILSGVSDLLAGETRNDIKRLIKGAADLAESGKRLADNLDAQNKVLGETLTSVKTLSDNLRVSVAELQTKVDGIFVRVDSVLATVDTQAKTLGDKTAGTIDRVDGFVQKATVVLDQSGPELAQTLTAARELSQKIQRIADALAAGEGVAGQLLVNRQLAQDLNNTAIDLSRTAAVIADHPETLVFGMSSQESAAQRARREREKQRRSFNEGYGAGIPVVVEVPPKATPPPATQPANP